MRRGKEEDDEVEQLLQAAQDEMILKLSVDSHTSSSKPDYLDPDLHSRFLALRSKPSQSQKKNDQHRQKRLPGSPPKPKDAEETPDDLMLRFAALKSTLPSSSSSVSPSVLPPHEIGEDADEIGEDAEVEKMIQWAIDAPVSILLLPLMMMMMMMMTTGVLITMMTMVQREMSNPNLNNMALPCKDFAIKLLKKIQCDQED